MKGQVSRYSFAVLVAGLFFACAAGAATQTIHATASGGGSTTGSAVVASPSKVTCTQATGGGATSRCFIQSPGWSGFLKAGQSIGTSGAGNVFLSCGGTYPVGGSLSCYAKIDDAACTAEQTISASSNSSGNTEGFAPIKSAALVKCTSATGGGTSSRCFIQSPGFGGLLQSGQSIGTSGAGTVALSCVGTYPVGGSLSCRAQVSQTCP